MQCREFLGQHPGIKVVEGEDTARSAEIIQQEHLKGHAAICSKAAAERYGMNLNTVKTSLFRTRKKLQKYLEQQGIVL